MTNIALLNSTNFPKIDQIISEIIKLGDYHFFKRIRGYYLVGSYAVGEAVATSDIDIVIVFKDKQTPEEKQRFTSYKQECQQQCPFALDLIPVDEAQLLSVGGVKFQTASLLMYGEDIRDSVPLKAVAGHIRDSMFGQYRLFAQLRGNPPQLTFPLGYPDPVGEFYGYDRRLMHLRDGASQKGIKDLVINVLSPADALILHKTGKYIGTGSWKRNCATQYRIWINDQWTELVEQIYEYCCRRWAYLIPKATGDRQLLHHLCKQALGFENHFLECYRSYLLEKLPQSQPFEQLQYVKQLGQLIYPGDRKLVTVLQELAQNGNPELQQAAVQTLELWQKSE
ncbi:MAG: nucleotidyltransferase domain-containing protein [Mojavia pulchra JT2-VF2]|uniref:Nucleotidyltransferase domain-containing protein n=1 Tax=Mojavia pulchra JT2-VF2 TaxID=287848 RepID=A0A951PYH8_9NOST|nr:nucleotidyltransferase domain-containing protein [Mojavia pulchra JT2-VF2]